MPRVRGLSAVDKASFVARTLAQHTVFPLATAIYSQHYNMADASSIEVAFAGVLKLGTQVSEAFEKLISNAISPPSLLKEVFGDLRLLCDVLGQLNSLVPQWKVSATDSSLLKLLENCRRSLDELEAVVKSIEGTFAKGRGYWKKWLRVTWFIKEKEIVSLLSSQILDHKSTLTLTLQMQIA